MTELLDCSAVEARPGRLVGSPEPGVRRNDSAPNRSPVARCSSSRPVSSGSCTASISVAPSYGPWVSRPRTAVGSMPAGPCERMPSSSWYRSPCGTPAVAACSTRSSRCSRAGSPTWRGVPTTGVRPVIGRPFPAYQRWVGSHSAISGSAAWTSSLTPRAVLRTPVPRGTAGAAEPAEASWCRGTCEREVSDMTPFPRRSWADRPTGLAGSVSLPDCGGAAARHASAGPGCHAFVWVAVGLFSVRGGAETTGGAGYELAPPEGSVGSVGGCRIVTSTAGLRSAGRAGGAGTSRSRARPG